MGVNEVTRDTLNTTVDIWHVTKWWPECGDKLVLQMDTRSSSTNIFADQAE